MLGRGQPIGRDLPTESIELMPGGTELVFDLGRPGEIAMQRVVGVDSDAAV